MAYLGCHISTSGGVHLSPERGKNLGCDAMQIFTANQRRWTNPKLKENFITEYHIQLEKNGIHTVVSHDSYLINLGSPDKEKLEKSRNAFIEEIERTDLLKIPFLVFHPGSHLGTGEDFCIKTIAESLNYTIESTPNSKTTLLIETTAGQGTNVGNKFEHLRDIIDLCQYPDKLGICLDTCHVFAAGYDIISEEKYIDTFNKLNDIVGLDRLKVFHLNDSKKKFGSKVDRHEILGKGFLGWEPFFRLVKDERFVDKPMLLETPGGDENYAREIAELKKQISKN